MDPVIEVHNRWITFCFDRHLDPGPLTPGHRITQSTVDSAAAAINIAPVVVAILIKRATQEIDRCVAHIRLDLVGAERPDIQHSPQLPHIIAHRLLNPLFGHPSLVDGLLQVFEQRGLAVTQCRVQITGRVVQQELQPGPSGITLVVGVPLVQVAAGARSLCHGG
ncbi:hypothetical protein C1X13_23730 [Pseudomonas sp. GW123-5C08]|nr:hypothetical protein C1X19_23685 [Pseudomonas sp. GW460-4]PMV65074.1 hypothetical protein C1X13_23730 [Pseudomonas sp. GW123-5C08]